MTVRFPPTDPLGFTDVEWNLYPSGNTMSEEKTQETTNLIAMPRIKGFDLFTIGVVIVAGVYTGTRFFEPLIIDQLRKDGHLRQDIPVPKYDNEGEPMDEIPMMKLREELAQLNKQEKDAARKS